MLSVEDQVDHLLGNSKPQCVTSHHGKRSGLSGFFRQFWYGALIGCLIVTITLVPIYGGRNGLDIIQDFSTDTVDDVDVVVVGDEPPLEPEAYHYWYAPPNSFGIQETKTVNWSYFKQLFLAHTDWMLEYKRYEYSEWTDGLDYLTIERTWNDTGFWKFNLILDVPVNIYSARFTFGIDLPCLQYVEREGYEVWINYTANATEIYSCMFNWSDIANIPGIIITKGKTDDMFWFRFRRDDIPAGHYEFDPTFGDTDTDATINMPSYYCRGLQASPATDGTATSITFSISSGGSSGEKVKGVLYDDDASDVLAITAEIGGTDGVHTVDFITPVAIFSANTYHIAVITGAANLDIHYSIDGGSFVRIFDNSIDFETGALPSPYIGDTDARGYLYCTYSEGAPENTAPTITGEIPANQSTGISVLPALNVTVDDADDDWLNVTCLSNSSSDWIWFARNSSIDGATLPLSIVQTNSNFSTELTKYWWSINVSDGTTWTNETYHFTTASNATWQNIDTTVNGSYYNDTITWQTIDSTINGSYSNTTAWRNIDTTINGSYVNTTIWRNIDTTINGSYINITAWRIIDITINGSYFNETIIWQNIDTTINGSYSNTTAFQVIDASINGSYINTTLWQVIDQTINGSYVNTTAWRNIDITINGSYYNDTILWQNIDTTINGSYSNTSLPWTVIDSTINGSYSNTSVVTLSLTDEYPANNSINVCPNSMEIGVTISNPDGGLMNVTFWSNLSGVWDYFYVGTLNSTLVNVGNGTYYINPVFFTRYNYMYYWNASVSNNTTTINSDVFSFTTASSPCGKGGGGGMGSSSVIGIIGLIGIFGILGYIMNRRRKNNYG